MTRLVNLFDLKSPAKSADAVYCYLDYNKLNLLRRNLPGDFQNIFPYIEMSDAGRNHFMCKSQTRETMLRVPFKTLMEVLPTRLDPHLRKWGSLSRILRTTYIDL